MADSDLSQALEESVDSPIGSSCCDETDPNFPPDMQLVITCNHKTMQRVAKLVVAINRMNTPLMKWGQELNDQQLCSMIFESLIEAKTVEMVENSSVKRVYHRVNSGNQCTLCDTAQKDLVQISERLHAITLKGGNWEKKVKFQMSNYVTADLTNKGQLVILSIKNSNLHITCSPKDGKAVLNLEEFPEAHLKTFSNEKNMDRFLFHGTIKGISESKFESVNCPGWYISTSSEAENQPLEMCEPDSASRVISFKINTLQ